MPSERVVGRARFVCGECVRRWGREIDNGRDDWAQSCKHFYSALDAERAEVWEEAAKIADSVIDPVDSPLTALSSQAAKFIAQLIRARAAALRVERKG